MAGFLVVNADDLGASKGATLGVKRAHLEGVLTSASLCVTTPAYRDALETCVRACPKLGIGLHASLTLGSPAADPDKVPLLIDDEGRFRLSFSSLFIEAAVQRSREFLEQVAIEIEAQFLRLERDSIRPDHVNGERHVHLIPGIFEIVVDAARRHGVRYVRAGRDGGVFALHAGNAFAMIANGGVPKSALLSTLAARARMKLGKVMRTPDRVVSYLFTGRADAVLSEVLSRHASGLCEVMLHPGVPSANGQLDATYRNVESYLMSPDRERELEACIRARKQATSWTLITYRELERQQ